MPLKIGCLDRVESYAAWPERSHILNGDSWVIRLREIGISMEGFNYVSQLAYLSPLTLCVLVDQ